MYKQIKYSLAIIILTQTIVCLSMNKFSEISVTLSKEIKNIKKDYCLIHLTLSDNSNLLIKHGEVYKENVEYYSVHEEGKLLFLKNDEQCELINLKNEETIFKIDYVKNHKILGCGRYMLLELYENKVKLIDLQDTQKIYDFENVDNTKNTCSNLLILTMTNGAKEIINLKNPEVRIKFENFKIYRLLGQTKLLITYKDNSASIYDLETGKELKIFKNIDDYDQYIRFSLFSQSLLHYQWDVIYFTHKKNNTMYYLGTNKQYKFKEIVKSHVNFTFLALKKDDGSFTLIDLINNETYDNVQSCSYNKKCKYGFVKFNDTQSTGILFNLEENKIMHELQDIDSAKFTENDTLLIKFGKTSPKILNLEDNSFIETELCNNTNSLSFLNKKLLCLICISQKNKFLKIINLKTKAKMTINDLCENGLQKLNPENLYWAKLEDGTKKLIETEKCKVLKTFKPENNARIKNDFLWYKEKNTQKMINFSAEIITAASVLSKQKDTRSRK